MTVAPPFACLVSLTLLLASACVTGCAEVAKCDVSVSSLCRPTADPARTYVILPSNKGVEADDLQFNEYAAYVERVLTSKGFERAADVADADMAVLLYYDVGSSEHDYAYSTPIYGQTGGGTAAYSGTTYGQHGSAYSSGTITQQPTYGVVGSEFRSGTVVVFHRYISLAAVDVRPVAGVDAKPTPIWETKIISSGSEADMRTMFPVLLAGASGYVGTNTKREVRVSLTAKDPRIKWVLGEAPAPGTNVAADKAVASTD